MANPIEIIEGLRNFEEGAGEFIRNGPSTGLPGYVRDGYRKRCDQFANLPPWARLLGNGPSGALDRICTPYWEDNGWDGPEVGPPPFTGGQCPGVPYGARYTWLSGPGANPSNYTPSLGQFLPGGRTLYGPLSGGSLVEGGGGLCTPSRSGYLVNGFDINGNPLSGLLNRGGASCLFPSSLDTIEGLGFERLTPGDECGSPPSTVIPGPNPPPDPGPLPGPEPTDDPDNPIGPPLIPLPPYQDPIYGPTPIVGPTGPPDTPPPPPGDIGDPGSSSDTAVGGESEGEAPEGSILVGLKIDVLTSPPKARQLAPGVFRGACYIYMGVTSNLDQDYGGSMLKSGQFFFAEKENLTHWLVSANSGYNHRVTPYYRETGE